MSFLYVRLLNLYKFEHQTVFLASFDEQDEDYQVLDQVELCINLKINKSLTETDIDDINFRSQLERQIQNQFLKGSGWRFNKISSKTIIL